MLASSQWGLFTSAQAQEIGVGRTQISRMQADGRIENLAPGVYRFTSGEETSFSDIKAHWMAIASKEPAYERIAKQKASAVVAGRTAAYMLGIGDMYATPYTFIVDKRKQTRNPNLKYVQWEIADEDIGTIGGLPVTKAERTIADLIKLKEDPSLIDDVVKDAVRQGLIDSQRLAKLLAPLAARNGYPRNNGSAFAQELILRNSSYQQTVIAALKPLQNLYANMDFMQEPLKKISSVLQDSSSYQQTSAAVSKSLSKALLDISRTVVTPPKMELPKMYMPEADMLKLANAISTSAALRAAVAKPSAEPDGTHPEEGADPSEI